MLAENNNTRKISKLYSNITNDLEYGEAIVDFITSLTHNPFEMIIGVSGTELEDIKNSGAEVLTYSIDTTDRFSIIIAFNVTEDKRIYRFTAYIIPKGKYD